MSFSAARFWTKVAAARHLAVRGEVSAARKALASAADMTTSDPAHASLERRALVDDLAAVYGLSGSSAHAVVTTRPRVPTTGVSLVTACRNRNSNLMRGLATWLACPQISEIIIVDWSSDTPVAEDLNCNGLKDERIQVVRVEEEPRWILSYAFNLGFASARFGTILKADADILLSPDFFDLNTLRPGAFIAGDWRTARDGQGFVNGFFYIDRETLSDVGGFNEFITSYGWDDEDLYGRLSDRGLIRDDVAPDSIRHLDHDDITRIETEPAHKGSPAVATLPTDTEFLIRRNRYIANAMPPWSEAQSAVEYDIIDIGAGVRRVRRRLQSGRRTPEVIEREASLAAARELLSWRFGERCFSITFEQVEALIQTRTWADLTSAQICQAIERGDSHQARGYPTQMHGPRTDRPKLFVDAQHGLGNRLRVIGSAAAVAKAQGREFIIVWRPDHHCDCRFGDLFEYDGPVIEDGEPATLLDEGGVFINYMEGEPGARKDAKVTVDPSKELYFRSAYVMNHQASSWDAENAFLRSLRPVKAVTDLVASVRHPNAVSAHVRMGSGPGFDHLPWEAAENWSDESHRELAHWREKSHVSRFEKRLDQLIDEGQAETIFLAADLPETYKRLLARYPDRIAHLSRPVNDRSGEQLRHALADAILLGQSKLLLGSTWSSFTELALRLAPRPPVQEMSGADF